MKILVLGGSGLIGRELVEFLKKDNEVEFTYNQNETEIEGCKGHKADMASPEEVVRIITDMKPDAVIHTVAPASVDWHEKQRKATYDINVITTKAVAEVTKEMGAKLVYISTTFVFPDTDHLFTEHDIPAPINFYGVTKVGGELAAANNPDNLIIRTDQIYGWARDGQKKSFVVKTLEKVEKGEKVEVCQDWLNSPTYVKDLCMAIWGLIQKDKKGVYHVVGNSFLNRETWARKIAEAFGKDPDLVVGINSGTLNLPAKRPNVHVSNEKVQKELDIRLMTIEEGLEDMKGGRA